jgi:hypothetical protein
MTPLIDRFKSQIDLVVLQLLIIGGGPNRIEGLRRISMLMSGIRSVPAAFGKN